MMTSENIKKDCGVLSLPLCPSTYLADNRVYV